jgi:hypothetical protein
MKNKKSLKDYYKRFNLFVKDLRGEDVDVIAVMRSGEGYAQQVSHCIENSFWFKRPNIRNLKFYPVVTNVPGAGEFRYKKDKARYDYGVSKGDIPSEISFEEYVQNPLLRLVGGEPMPERLAIIVDDVEAYGETLIEVTAATRSLGYNPKNTFVINNYQVYYGPVTVVSPSSEELDYLAKVYQEKIGKSRLKLGERK